MIRPICQACNKRPAAINYISENRTHYRSRCEACIRKGRRAKLPTPRWQIKGYKKKPTCDRCGFRAIVQSQLLVYHIDGNLNNSDLRNLRTICLNCTEEIKRLDLPWRPGDLEPDH